MKMSTNGARLAAELAAAGGRAALEGVGGRGELPDPQKLRMIGRTIMRS